MIPEPTGSPKAPLTTAVAVGCAGWTIPRAHSGHFPNEGSHLARYATRFAAAEIDSSFYRTHKPATYARWATAVPEHFRFAVKVPKQVTHTSRLTDVAAFNHFYSGVSALGEKLGPLLLQLPPSLAFHAETVRPFFVALRNVHDGSVACEPRHASWFTVEADELLAEWRIARVAADPAVVAAAGRPGGWAGLSYFRLHGSPRMYYSAYGAEYLASLAHLLSEAARSAPAWCIFDNTAAGAATLDALTLLDFLAAP